MPCKMPHKRLFLKFTNIRRHVNIVYLQFLHIVPFVVIGILCLDSVPFDGIS